MSDISKIDKNLAVSKEICKDGFRFYDTFESPFVISGLLYVDGVFCRMVPSVAERVSENVRGLNYHTSGGRIRFRTDSRRVAIAAKYESVSKMSHMPFCASIGFDLYADNVYRGTFKPPVDIELDLEGVVELGEGGMREITVNFPLYSSVRSVLIGLDEGANVEEPTPYINTKPVVYYGSSITQGACASRPGNCYQAQLSRKFNLDYINLGFSGSAKAEDAIIEYIKGLDMSLFVYDYDHNAPSPEYLRSTHEKMFLAIREAHPTLPIIMMSRPRKIRNDKDQMRLEVVKESYLRAKERGDERVYFLDGDDLTVLCGSDGMVDGTHPTDFGFASMVKALSELIEREGIIDKMIK